MIELIQKIPGFPNEKNSGYCTIISVADGRVLLSFQVGHCPREKFEKYYSFSHEKAQRLRKFVFDGHVSSWQSRDESAGQWGGAISAGSVIFSFSGLPELADEAIMLMAAVTCNFMSPETAIEIARISGNKFFTDLDQLLGQ